MKIRIVLLVLAVVFGVAAVFGVMIYLNNVKNAVEKESELISVLVAVKTIEKNTSADILLSEKFVESKQMPIKYITEGAIDNLDSYADYVTVEQISKGEQITPLKLMKSEDVIVPFTVPDGLMAVSIPYDEIRGVAYYVKSGDKVNIIATLEPKSQDILILTKEMLLNLILNQTQDQQQYENANADGSAGETRSSSGFFSLSETAEKAEAIMGDKAYAIYPQTKILLWNIQVLGVGAKVIDSPQSSDEADGNNTAAAKTNVKETIKTVTLAVTPEQAEKLIFAQELGKVWFAMMPNKGLNEQETPGRNYFNISD